MSKDYNYVTNKEKQLQYSAQVINDLYLTSEQVRKKMQELNKKRPEEIQKEYEYILQLSRKQDKTQK